MKRKIISLLVFMFVVLCVQAQRIEVEPRVGISYSGEENGNFGFHAGGLVSFGLSERFSIQPGVFVNTVQLVSYSNDVNFDIPVYASWKVPVKQVNLRFNAGPYLALNQEVSMGGSLETGVEYRKWYAGIAYFQNITKQGSFFNLSLGYRISL